LKVQPGDFAVVGFFRFGAVDMPVGLGGKTPSWPHPLRNRHRLPNTGSSTQTDHQGAEL